MKRFWSWNIYKLLYVELGQWLSGEPLKFFICLRYTSLPFAAPIPWSVTLLLLFDKGYKGERNVLSYLKVIQKHARNVCLIGTGATSFRGDEQGRQGERQHREDEKALRQLRVKSEVKGLWVEAEARRLMRMSVCRNGIYLRSSRYTRWSAHCRWSHSGKYLLWWWWWWGMSVCKD